MNKYNKKGWINIILGILLLIISIKSVIIDHNVLVGIIMALLGYVNLKIAKWNKLRSDKYE